MTKLNKILEIAAFAGKMILENGGETYRSEDIVVRICENHGVEADCFSLLSGLMVSVKKGNKSATTIIRIKSRTINLEKVHKLNNLARNSNDYTCEEFMKELKKIDKTPRYSVPSNLFGYALTGAAFTLLFGGTFNDFLFSLPIGAAIYILSYSFSKYELNGIFVNTVGGALSTYLAYYFQSIGYVDNTDKVIIGTLMTLVPGIALTNGIRDIVAGDYIAGMSRGLEALLVATSLAIGTGFAISLYTGGSF